ncbi:LPS O-antigen length regulator [Vibrio albus]|uniref:LPS O-antigen length regulator n=1 Tax=Vibrio albus TaxID=2200953 RepID=A0A2U3BCP3_9VIBR|nr:Wzz/FepE/Etk N-terminal domain-containing protein [Vibrio albus]PWI34559.1 LPS O-antigen length regulator [Vibrio albus]
MSKQIPEQHYQYPYPPQPMAASDDEIDVKELFLAFWKGKWIILLTTIIFAAGGVFYARSLPNIYKAEAVLAPAQESGKSGLASMAAQFGGLASLAGINIGGSGTDNTAMALAILQSRKFINAFINKHDLLVPLMAAKQWNAESNKLVIDSEVYNSSTQEWVREVEPGQSPTPTDWEAYRVFKEEILSIEEAKDSGLVIFSVNHYSPEIAQQWVTWLVGDLNAWMKDNSLAKTKRNIGYLEQQLEKTKIADMRSVFYQLIEEQTKNLMLAEVEEEFVFQTVDPAVIPEEKAMPRRALICFVVTLFGGMLGVVVVMIRFAFRN